MKHALAWICVCWPLAATGCRTPARPIHAEYEQLSQQVQQAWCQLEPRVHAIPPVVSELAGPHPVDDYVQAALARNPTIQAGRLRVEAAASRVPQAASLEDPMLGVTVQAQPLQTAAGQQELALMASQKLPGFGKLAAATRRAEEELDVARAELHAMELELIADVKRTYYQLYFVQQAIQITAEDLEQLDLIASIVQRRYEVDSRVRQQDVLQVQVESAQLRAERLRLAQELAAARAKLTRLLHISPETELAAVEQLSPMAFPRDLEALYETAILASPDLQAQLAAVDAERSRVDQARLQANPDLTLGATWVDIASAGLSPVANGRDAFLLNVGVNLPIYRQRISAQVREAEATAIAAARQYDSLRDRTLESVKDLYTKASSQQQLLQLFQDEIIPKTRQSLEQSLRTYQVGEIEFVQLIDIWRQWLRYQVTERQLEAELGQTLASLARTVGQIELQSESWQESELLHVE